MTSPGVSPSAFPCGIPNATACATRLSSRFALPITAFASWITRPSPRARAAKAGGTDAYAPKPTSTSVFRSRISRRAAR